MSKKPLERILADPQMQENCILLPFDRKINDVLHASDKRCPEVAALARDSSLASSLLEKVKVNVLLLDIDIKSTCSACALYQLYRDSEGRVFFNLATAEALVERILDPSECWSFLSLDDAQSRLENALDGLEEIVDSPEVRKFQTRIETLLELQGEVGAKLLEIYSTEKSRQEVSNFVFDELGEENFEEEMLLTGCIMSSFSSNRWVWGILLGFLIYADGGKVAIRAPGYVKAFVEKRWSFRIKTGSASVSAVKAPEQLDLCEVAAKLWDPLGGGPLSTMEGALLTAQAL